MSLLSTIFRKQPIERGDDEVSQAINNDIGNLQASIRRLDRAYEAFMNEDGVLEVAKQALHHRKDDRKH